MGGPGPPRRAPGGPGGPGAASRGFGWGSGWACGARDSREGTDWGLWVGLGAPTAVRGSVGSEWACVAPGQRRGADRGSRWAWGARGSREGLRVGLGELGGSGQPGRPGGVPGTWGAGAPTSDPREGCLRGVGCSCYSQRPYYYHCFEMGAGGSRAPSRRGRANPSREGRVGAPGVQEARVGPRRGRNAGQRRGGVVSGGG